MIGRRPDTPEYTMANEVQSRLTTPDMQARFKRWFDAAPIYSGSIVANRGGWQVVRSVA